jgi:uncharacterized repeat protein (TIGR03803 family)
MQMNRLFSCGVGTTRSFTENLFQATCVLLAFAGLFGCIRAEAQKATIRTFGPSAVDTYSGVISASDGNFYAVTADDEYNGFNPADFGCPDQSANDCTFIDKITPSGQVTVLHIFETAGFGSNGGVPNHDGFGPTPLVEGPDGFLYGSAVSGGAAGYGTIFQISPTGVFTLVFTFPNTGTASNPVAPYGAYPSRLIFGKDGNLYGTSQQLNGGYYLFQVTTTGSATIIATSTVPGDLAPQSIVQGSDGTFYAVNGVSVEQITLGGFINVIHNFVMNESQTMAPIGTLVEGPDQNFYGADDMSGAIFQVSPSGSVNVIHTLQPVEGELLDPEITLGSDGNFYGTTYLGGIDTACPSGTQAGDGIGCGTVFQVTRAGDYTNLYSFLGTSVDGAQPDGWLLEGSAGNLYGTFFNPTLPANNVMFSLTPATPLPAPIQITFSPENPEPEKLLTVNWSVLNAFSATMQQCHGQLSGGPNNAVAPLGPLNGTLTGKLYSGTYSFTPVAAGSYTFTLNCGGIETASASVTVGNGVTIITTSPFPGGTVSKKYSTTVEATGGKLPYTWGILNGMPLPAGLTAGTDSNGTLYITGTPTQFGAYTVGIGLLDSSNPQQPTQKTFQLAIASGLTLAPALENGQIGKAYNQTASADGGLGPYKWALTSGKLPTGLILNTTTGVISGTPTAAGSFKFSITVSDSEGTPATYTESYTVSTSPDPLTVPYQQFDCMVHSECTGTLAATGGIPPYTWKVSAQTPLPGQNPIYVSPPPTLTFSSNGSFSGVPTQWADKSVGGITIDVQVTDSETPPVSVSEKATFNIASDLAVTSIPLPEAYLGSTYLSPVPTASGGTPPYKWVIVPNSSSYLPYFYADADGQIGFPTPKGNAPTIAGDYGFSYIVSDSEGVPANASMQATLDILPTPVNSVTTLSSSNTNAGTGMNVTLMATVTAPGVTPTGNVTFYNGNASLGTEALGATGTASLTTSFSAAGVYSLTASYAGAGSVQGSVSTVVTETVVTPTVSASFSPSTLTVAPGSSGTLTLTLTPVGGFTGTVNFSCGSLPPYVGCSFAPPSLTIAAGQTTSTDVLTITTNNTSMSRADRPGSQLPDRLFLAITLLSFWVLPVARFRRGSLRVSRLFGLAILAVGLGAFCGCGGHKDLAAPGTYAIPITLQLPGGATQQVTANVVVQ